MKTTIQIDEKDHEHQRLEGSAWLCRVTKAMLAALLISGSV